MLSKLWATCEIWVKFLSRNSKVFEINTNYLSCLVDNQAYNLFVCTLCPCLTSLLGYLCGPVINSVFGRRCRKVVSRGKEDTRVWYWETMFSQMVSALLMFLDISSTILWRCKLKSLQNGNLKKRIIHLSRNIIHMTYMTFIFLKVFWIRTNTVNVRGRNSINILSKWTVGF